MVRTPPEMRRHGTVGRDIRSSLRAGWQILQAIVIFALIAYVIWHGAAAMDYGWQWYRVEPFFYRVVDGEIIWGPLIRGLVMTLKLAAISAVIAIVIGFVAALARLSSSTAGRAITTCYLEIIRNTPLLVQPFLFYFVLAPIFDIDRFWACVLCLAAFEGAFAAKIIRAGILGVDRGQYEAADAVGLGRVDKYRYVVIPQSMPLILPPLTQIMLTIITGLLRWPEDSPGDRADNG